MKKPLLQRISAVCAIGSFVLALIAGIMLFMADPSEEVYRASVGACTFFFFTVGIVLHAMGSANLPSFKPDEPSK